MVDIARPPEVLRRKKIRRIIYGVATLLAVVLITVGVSRLQPAAPPVDGNAVWIDTVKRGPFTRSVRGTGRLVPAVIRWVAAPAAGRVDRIVLRPGARVEADTVVIEMSNPELEQAVAEARLALEGAEARLQKARADLTSELLMREATVADVEARYEQASAGAEAREALHKEGLESELVVREFTSSARGLAKQLEAERKRLEVTRETAPEQLAEQEAEVNRLRTMYELRRKQLDDLQVRAGLAGVLQEIPADEIGAQIAQGENLFRVADPSQLRAELRIPETQARDVDIQQRAAVDTRNGIVRGYVSRIDPAAEEGTVTVDVELEGDLPRGARANLTVDGTITLEHLEDVVFVGRPAFGQEDSTITLFKLLAKAPQRTGDAVATKVQLGRNSVNTVEIVAGLEPGDQVILSDMSQFEDANRVRVN